MDLNKITNVEVEGIDMKDYPDFVNAFISYAEYDGVPMTDEELDWLNDQSDFVYEKTLEFLY